VIDGCGIPGVYRSSKRQDNRSIYGAGHDVTAGAKVHPTPFHATLFRLSYIRKCFPFFVDCAVKPKFHYADFATKSGTSFRQSRGLVADTNHESSRHKSRRRLSWFVSATSPRPCRKLVPDFVADFPPCIVNAKKQVNLRLPLIFQKQKKCFRCLSLGPAVRFLMHTTIE